jgi:hypothetical protein
VRLLRLQSDPRALAHFQVLLRVHEQRPFERGLAHLIAQQEDGYWKVGALGAPHIGERSEKELIAAFVERIAELTPQPITLTETLSTCPYCVIAQWAVRPSLFHTAQKGLLAPWVAT